MKKLLLTFGAFLFVMTLSGCGDLCVGAECVLEAEEPQVVECEEGQIAVDGVCVEDLEHCEDVVAEACEEGKELVDGECVAEETAPQIQTTLLPYEHINGHGIIEEREAVVLFENKLRDYVKYQISYISCTCRGPEVNYWQVMYVELDIANNRIQKISFTDDGGHYTAGLWGDSSPTPGGKTLENFETEFIPWLVGQTKDDLEGISVFKNADYHGVSNTKTIDDPDGLIDAYTGSSVSTNNMIRAVKVLLDYHDEKY